MDSAYIKRMDEYTDQHVRDPQPGDHFTEHLGSVAYIEAREGKRVTLKRTAIINGKKDWGPTETISVDEFIKWASYGTIPGYWLELCPPQWPEELLAGG